MQKGLEMPVNMIIVIAIAVLVLVALSGFFGGQFFSGSDQIGSQKSFADGCNALRNSNNCDHTKINSMNIDGKGFGGICIGNGFSDTVQCARGCGCTVPSIEQGVPLQYSGKTSSGVPEPEKTETGTEKESKDTEPSLEIVSVDILG